MKAVDSRKHNTNDVVTAMQCFALTEYDSVGCSEITKWDEPLRG